MVKKYSFYCPLCNKKFEIKGHWYNQFVMKIFLDLKYSVHKLIAHKKIYFKEILRNICFFTLALFLQIIFLPCELIRFFY